MTKKSDKIKGANDVPILILCKPVKISVRLWVRFRYLLENVENFFFFIHIKRVFIVILVMRQKFEYW